MWLIGLLACGESVTFEEEPVEEVAAEAPPEAVEDDYEPVKPPIDGVQAQATEAAPKPGGPPAPGAPWPPIVVPEDTREREWKWDFKSSPNVKKDREREPTIEELNELEFQTEASGEVL